MDLPERVCGAFGFPSSAPQIYIINYLDTKYIYLSICGEEKGKISSVKLGDLLAIETNFWPVKPLRLFLPYEPPTRRVFLPPKRTLALTRALSCAAPAAPCLAGFPAS